MERSTLSIRDVEEMVGKKAGNVEIREREVVVVFSGGITGDGGLAADVCWHLPR